LSIIVLNQLFRVVGSTSLPSHGRRRRALRSGPKHELPRTQVHRASPRRKHPAAPATQPLEPILFPKLRIYFADFPYLHYSKTRVFETWRPDAVMSTACGENDCMIRIFTNRPWGTEQGQKSGACSCCAADMSLSVKEFHSPLYEPIKKKRKLLSGSGPASSDAVALPRSARCDPRSIHQASWGILAPFPFSRLGCPKAPVFRPSTLD